jgi:hypothetical protein
MLKFFASLLKRKPVPSGIGDDLADDAAPIFEGLTMTPELREALFPTTPRMISAIFDRPAPLDRPSLPSAPAQASASGDFPLIL